MNNESSSNYSFEPLDFTSLRICSEKNPQMMRLSVETSVHISAQIHFIPTLRNVVSLYVMNENTHNADNSLSIQTRYVSGTDVLCSGFTLQLPILP